MKVDNKTREFIKEVVTDLRGEFGTAYLQASRTLEITKYKNVYTYNYDGLYFHLFLSMKDVILWLLDRHDECLRIDITEDEYNEL